MLHPVLKLDNTTFRKYQHIVFPDTHWEMYPGENWALTGGNGSGKTTFLETIDGILFKTDGNMFWNFGDTAGNNPDPQQHIASVYFSDREVNYGNFYYQQRYHATETDGIITTRKFMGLAENTDLSGLQALGIDHLLDLEIIKLSNGQFKKVVIAKALLKKPRLLLLDNLYTGLDVYARAYLSDTLGQVTKMGTQLIVVTGSQFLPESITHIMEIDKFRIHKTGTRKNYMLNSPVYHMPELPVLPKAPLNTFDTVVRLDKVHIAYNGKTVINQVDWTVQQGDKWVLMGPNGSGKSMLLSLIFADNPQAYANRITLFDRKRGTGESIWDIKDKIGFVSPEMHLYFTSAKTCREVALGGLSENPYKHHQHKDTSLITLADDLFAYFAIMPFAGTLFQRVSTGQQNIILLIRALVKNPDMLILDEPFQGVDQQMVAQCRHLLDAYCRDRTLIFVSHQPEELPTCISHRLYIENGNAVMQ